MECGVLNWPGAVPLEPQDFTNFPFLSNFATLELPYPSDTKILPALSQATSVGRLKLSPATPAPAAAPPRPASRAATGTDSGFLPIVINIRPSELNLTPMFDPSSTPKMLSCGSTRTT